MDGRGSSTASYLEKSKLLLPSSADEMQAFSGKEHFIFFTYMDFFFFNHKTNSIQNIWKSETHFP
jgi:nucleoside-specific outer membrane channel protein Tsx